MSINKKITMLVCVVILSGCTYLDRYNKAFNTVSVGDSPERVVIVMGSPDDEKVLTIAMLEVKQMIWKSYLGNKGYVVYYFKGHVVAKTKI